MSNYFDEVHRVEINKLNKTIAGRTEWPTWLLLIGFYAIWIWVIFGNGLGTIPMVLILIPLLVLWMSIQHELIHGHPTSSAFINTLLGIAPFAIWYPYALYRDEHWAHHKDEVLTFPGLDPESRYISRAAWNTASKFKRILLWSNKTLAGRLIIGAPMAIFELFGSELNKIFNGGSRLGVWLVHLLGVMLLLIAIEFYSAISAAQYVFCVSIPALSIAMVRSFYEHRPSVVPEHRIAIIESSGPLSWIFLHLNLHLVHHELPGVPWFYLPRVYKARRAQWIARNNGFVIHGYYELFSHYLTKPVDSPMHPRAQANTYVHHGMSNDTL